MDAFRDEASSKLGWEGSIHQWDGLDRTVCRAMYQPCGKASYTTKQQQKKDNENGNVHANLSLLILEQLILCSPSTHTAVPAD